MVHLGDFAKRRPHELSGGMRQRVALARALAQDADVLLMDEPFGALDAMTRDRLHDELEALWTSTGKTVIFVTHNVREAVRLGDCVVLLASRPGRVAAVYDVTIPRPRRIDSPEVATLAATITDQLREEVAVAVATDLDLAALGRRRRRRTARGRVRRSARGAPRGRSSSRSRIVIGVWQIVVWLAAGSPSTSCRRRSRCSTSCFHDRGTDARRRAWSRCAAAPQGFVVAIAHRRRRRHRGRARQGAARRDRLDDHRACRRCRRSRGSRSRSSCSTRARARSCSSSCSARRRRSPTASSTASTTCRRSCSAPAACSARAGSARCGYVVIPAALPSVVGGLEAGLGVRVAQPDGRRAHRRSPRPRSASASCSTARSDTADYVGVFEAMIVILDHRHPGRRLVFGTADRAIRRRYGLIDAAAS